MAARTMVAVAILALGAAALTTPAAARVHRHARALTVTRSHGVAVPPDPLVEATPNFTGQNGKTTDVNVFPDLAIGDGFNGFQNPGLDSYGFAGGGLTPNQLQ